MLFSVAPTSAATKRRRLTGHALVTLLLLLAHCHTGCGLATSQFLSHDHFVDHALDILAQVAPALFGIFWGAPLLARELETGTYRLANSSKK